MNRKVNRGNEVPDHKRSRVSFFFFHGQLIVNSDSPNSTNPVAALVYEELKSARSYIGRIHATFFESSTRQSRHSLSCSIVHPTNKYGRENSLVSAIVGIFDLVPIHFDGSILFCVSLDLNQTLLVRESYNSYKPRPTHQMNSSH